jgi:hypothetical protein
MPPKAGLAGGRRAGRHPGAAIYQRLEVGRARLEPATNGLWVLIRGAHDQEKRLGETAHIPCETTNLAVAGTVPVRLE